MPTAKKKPAPKRPNAGTSLQAAARRRELFIAAYLTNGNNGQAAAITAGFNPATARQKACNLLAEPDVAARVAQVAEAAAVEAGLSVERWAKEMACIGHVDPGRFYRPDGTLIPLHELPEDLRRAIASVEPVGTGEAAGFKIKLWDKNAALANIGKHLGVFERDNHQRAEGVKVLVQLVG